jgi:hypothetical protein
MRDYSLIRREAQIGPWRQAKACHLSGSPTKIGHSGECRNLFGVIGIPVFAGMAELEASPP